MFRIACPSCRLIFFLIASSEEEELTCPRCGARFNPTEEELIDPEDD